MCPINLLTIYINRMDPSHVLFFFLSYNSRKKYGIFHAYIFIFNRPPQNKHFRIEFQLVLLANEGVIFRKERLSNFQISVSDNNLFDSSPELLASICSLFPVMSRYSLSASFPDKSTLWLPLYWFPIIISLYLLCSYTWSFPHSEFWAANISLLSIASNPPVNQ